MLNSLLKKLLPRKKTKLVFLDGADRWNPNWKPEEDTPSKKLRKITLIS